MIRFLLHATSLSKEIYTTGTPAYRLVRMTSFDEISILSLPTQDNKLEQLFNEQRIISTRYDTNGNTIGLIGSDRSQRSVAYHPPKNIWLPIAPDSTVTLADLFASRHADFLVVGADEPSLGQKVAGDNIISSEKAIELIRILFTAHNLLYLTNKQQPVMGLFYHVYRFKKLFPEYQMAWTVAAHAHGKTLTDLMHNHLSSLGNRLDLLCQSYDKIAFYSLKSAQYSAQNQILYHLAFFIMLFTGVCDELAHIMSTYYQFSVKGRMNIGLRISPQGKGHTRKKYYQLLGSHNKNLFNFLSRDNIQKGLNIIYPLRDSLQHRELFQGVTLHAMPESPQNVCVISTETANEIKDLSMDQDFISHGPTCFLFPLPFIEWALEQLKDIVNTSLSLVDWSIYYNGLPSEVVDKIQLSHEQFRNGFWRSLNWPKEPLYF